MMEKKKNDIHSMIIYDFKFLEEDHSNETESIFNTEVLFYNYCCKIK